MHYEAISFLTLHAWRNNPDQLGRVVPVIRVVHHPHRGQSFRRFVYDTTFFVPLDVCPQADQQRMRTILATAPTGEVWPFGMCSSQHGITCMGMSWLNIHSKESPIIRNWVDLLAAVLNNKTDFREVAVKFIQLMEISRTQSKSNI
ncbi:hypothetical protein, partial [Aetokthonos hydrillicola]|uniref:hypothetical protein n=1 Tax=Aetokthonos hydrillicola TaxID=1550245 RepID=UPI001ABA7BCF